MPTYDVSCLIHGGLIRTDSLAVAKSIAKLHRQEYSTECTAPVTIRCVHATEQAIRDIIKTARSVLEHGEIDTELVVELVDILEWLLNEVIQEHERDCGEYPRHKPNCLASDIGLIP